MKYLDLWELAAVLGISSSTLKRRLNSNPWNVPPIANLGRRGLLRWRQSDVETWMVELGKNGARRVEMKVCCDMGSERGQNQCRNSL